MCSLGPLHPFHALPVLGSLQGLLTYVCSPNSLLSTQLSVRCQPVVSSVCLPLYSYACSTDSLVAGP